MLERRGDVHSALKIYIQTLDRANRQLVAAVQSGQLDLAGMAAAAVAEEVDSGSQHGASVAARLGGRSSVAALLRTRQPLPRGGNVGTAAGANASSTAAAAVASLLDSSFAPPRELQAARDALSSAIAMCLRQGCLCCLLLRNAWEDACFDARAPFQLPCQRLRRPVAFAKFVFMVSCPPVHRLDVGLVPSA